MIGRQRGFALIIASLALLVVASIALLLVTESGMGQAQAVSDAERAQLEYVTEAGLAHARWALAQNVECMNYPTISKTSFGNDSYDAVFTPSVGSPVTVAVTGQLANGVVRTADLYGVRAYEAANVLVLQPGWGEGKDTFLKEDPGNQNFGSSYNMWIENSNGAGEDDHIALQFDLSSVPAGVTVLSAVLEIYKEYGVTAGDVAVHRLTSDWTAGSFSGFPGSGASWYESEPGTNWTTPGGDFDIDTVATTFIPTGWNKWYQWDIKTLVQSWVSGTYVNQGMILKGASPGTLVSFYASEASGKIQPKLTVTYACECGVTCGTPSAGSVLLVVPDPSNLTVQLQAKKTLIESWNYAVNLIDESDSLSNFDTAFAANDVVYVPQEINSANLDTKLFKADIGVVNEEGEQVDELGFSQDKLFKSRDQIDVVDNTHYITEVFPTGLLTYLSSQQSVHMLSGTQAGGLQILGESLNVGSLWAPSLAVLEKDSALYGGGNAWGRRVQLPWGGGTFDVDELNDDGRTLMQRSIEWAAGGGAAAPTLVGHWKLDDATGTTAIDSSLRGNDGTLAGGPDWTSGYLAGALAFDQASSDRVLVPDAPSLDIADAITMTAWIKPNATGTQYVIRKAQFGSTDGYELSLSTTGKVLFRLNEQSQGDTWRIDSTTSYPSDGATWMHIAATYDGVTQRLYINGVEEASQPASITINTNDTDLSLGGQVDGSRVIDGMIDDVRLYSSALDAAAIADLAAAVRTGPIAHWMLDEGTGTTAVDSAGGHDGTLVNWPATPTWVPGLLDGGLSFDGSNDHVDVGTFDVAGSGLTLMGWFNADALPDTTDPRLISKASSTAEADAWWQLSILTNAGSANIRLRTKAGGTTSTLIDSSTDLNTGEWYFAVGTYDAATGEMKLYLNGIEVASQTHPVAGPVNTNGSVPVALGANGSPEQFFDGVLDDLRVYDRALSASEISDLYVVGPGTCIFRDEFESQNYNNQDGNALWAADWLEINDGGSPTGGDVMLTGGGNPGNALRVQDDNKGVSRSLDLSGQTSVILTFDYKRISLESGEHVAVSVFDGSAWHELAQLGNPPVANDSDYQSFSQDISVHATAASAIRFLSPSGGMGNADDVNFDNVQIEASGAPCP